MELITKRSGLLKATEEYAPAGDELGEANRGLLLQAELTEGNYLYHPCYV
jgi:hypothetical protein